MREVVIVAAALGLRPLARTVDSVLVGSDPFLMLTGPIPATRRFWSATTYASTTSRRSLRLFSRAGARW